MERNDISKIEESYKAQIADLKAEFIAEKEELTNLFLNKLKEVENYHKKMLQDLVAKSNSDLDAIQSKYEEKISFITKVHNQEVNFLQARIDALTEQLREALADISEGRTPSTDKISSVLSGGKKM